MIGISALKYDLEDKISLFHKYKEIDFIEYGIDEVSDIEILKFNLDKPKNKDIKISIHLPLKTNLVEDIGFLRDSNFNYVSEIIREVNFFEPLYFNTHLGNVFYKKYNLNYKLYINKAKKFIEKLLYDFPYINIYIENVYSFLNKDSSDLAAIGTSPSEFIDLINSVNNKSLGFCFDLGHCMIQNEDFSCVLNSCNSMLHFSVNDKKTDMHLGLSDKGKYKKTFFYKLINNYNFKYIVLEMDILQTKKTLDILGLNII